LGHKVQVHLFTSNKSLFDGLGRKLLSQPTNSCWAEYSTHTHTRLTALCPGLPRWAGTRKVKPVWILLKQQTVSGSGISWTVCKSAPRSRQITTPASHRAVFLQAGCPSCRPANRVKALLSRIQYFQKISYYRLWYKGKSADDGTSTSKGIPPVKILYNFPKTSKHEKLKKVY